MDGALGSKKTIAKCLKPAFLLKGQLGATPSVSLSVIVFRLIRKEPYSPADL